MSVSPRSLAFMGVGDGAVSSAHLGVVSSFWGAFNRPVFAIDIVALRSLHAKATASPSESTVLFVAGIMSIASKIARTVNVDGVASTLNASMLLPREIVRRLVAKESFP